MPIDPVAWEAPEAPAAEGVYAPNDALAGVTVLPVPDGDHGPEDLHVLGGYRSQDDALVRTQLRRREGKRKPVRGNRGEHLLWT